jgi:hypothetical protein
MKVMKVSAGTIRLAYGGPANTHTANVAFITFIAPKVRKVRKVISISSPCRNWHALELHKFIGAKSSNMVTARPHRWGYRQRPKLESVDDPSFAAAQPFCQPMGRDAAAVACNTHQQVMEFRAHRLAFLILLAAYLGDFKGGNAAAVGQVPPPQREQFAQVGQIGVFFACRFHAVDRVGFAEPDQGRPDPGAMSRLEQM